MSADKFLVECVAFFLVNDRSILVEKRSLAKRVVPGALAIPGGHMEVGEPPEDALLREIREELDVVPTQSYYVCTLLHRAEEFRKLHYFAILAWNGVIQAKEAAEVYWLPITELSTLSLDVGQIAMQEYARVYGNVTNQT